MIVTLSAGNAHPHGQKAAAVPVQSCYSSRDCCAREGIEKCMCCCAHLTLNICRERQEAAACHLLPIPILSSFLSGLGCLLSDPSVLPCTHACWLHQAQQTHWQQPSLYLVALQECLMFPCLPGHCCPQPPQCPWSLSASCWATGHQDASRGASWHPSCRLYRP
jgi:hypothetical protein